MIMFKEILRWVKPYPYVLVVGATLSACGGGGGGSRAPAPPPVTQPPPPTITSIDVGFATADVIADPVDTGGATAVVDYNETDGEISASVTLQSMTAAGVTLNRAAAGAVGPELVSLTSGSSPDVWNLADTPLSADEIDALTAGELYLTITSDATPGGTLRGQILPAGVSVERVALVPRQVPSGSSSAGSARAWLTLNDNAGVITTHLVSDGLTDADGATLRDALAGNEGPVLETLVQDPADPAHWVLDPTPYSQALQDALADASVYLEVTAPGAPDGAVRGQYVPPTHELVITDLRDDSVVSVGSPRKALASRAITGAVMTTIGTDSLTSVLNIPGSPDADAVSLHRAPAGQNGPAIADFAQDVNDPSRWMLADLAIDTAVAAGLANQTLYAQVTTPTAPDGAARGQIVTEASTEPPTDGDFVVLQVSPENAATEAQFPSSIVATLNRAPLAESVSSASVAIEASGGDGSFGDGNESTITPSSVSVSGNDLVIGTEGIAANDDVYRVLLFGNGASGILDTSGIPLDGDGDGSPGGTYQTAFEVESPPPAAATFTDIQTTIFTPSCATSGCHSGANPPDGLNLSAGMAYGDIVNVASVQMPSLFLIEPGDPDSSYLVRKIQGTGIVANRMPLNASPLSQAQIDLVREWVMNGAPNN